MIKDTAIYYPHKYVMRANFCTKYFQNKTDNPPALEDVDLTEILLQDKKFLHLPPCSKFSESVPYFVSYNPCEQMPVL